MSAACLVAAIALSAVAFMLRFLAALLHESSPSVCYWVASVRGEIERGTEKERNLGFASDIYVDEDFRSIESDHGDNYQELENESYAKEFASGRIAIHIRAVPHNVGWRSIQPNRAVFRQRRVWIS